MFKKLFTTKQKEKKTPEELGRLLYQVVQMGLQNEKLSVDKLLESLGLAKNEVSQNYEAEVVIALMFQVILVVEKQYDYPLAGDILDGMTKEFLSHAKEMGQNEEDLKYTLTLFLNRTKEYYEADKNTNGDGPAYWLGKKIYENLTETNQNHVNDFDRDADMPIKLNFLIAANFFTATLTGVDSLLKDYTVKK